VFKVTKNGKVLAVKVPFKASVIKEIAHIKQLQSKGFVNK